jgi:hypothetical protein
MTDETTTTKKAGLSPIEVGAGAGAAVITAFATSYLGTAGTLAGAALASVVGTVSTSVLRSSAQNSAERLKHTTTRLRDTRVGHADATDIRPVESEDIDPYGTQLFHTANWIDPETLRNHGRSDPDRTRQIGPGGPDRGAGGRPYDRNNTGHLEAGGAGSQGRGETVGRFRSGTDLWGSDGLGGAAGSDPGSAWGTPADHDGPDGNRRPDHAEAGIGAAERPGAGRGRRARWIVVGAGAVAAFALSLGAITGIEAIAGKPLSGLAGQESGGGTTLGRATGADRNTGGSTPTPTPTTGGATATEPAPSNGTSPSGGAPATTPSGSPGTSVNPAPTPTQPAPTQAPSGSPNPTP